MALKIRVMPTLLYKDLGLVKGKGFDSWRRTGSIMQAVKVYNMREVDELVFVDVTATQQEREPDFETIDEIADECFMPLTVGGGIRSVEDVRRLLMVGADKIAINSEAVEKPSLIRDIARRFGSQCVVVSIDFRKHADGRYEVFTESGTKATGLDPVEWA
ncbi:MAG: imidazole glycerol phosphate synthase cyclase subunit, partial [Candidatus Zixiibacteriota bacterium]